MRRFVSQLPNGFYAILNKEVKTVTVLKKSVKVNDVEIIDASLIYSRVIALQLTNNALEIENVFKFELAPIPTSMFEDTG